MVNPYQNCAGRGGIYTHLPDYYTETKCYHEDWWNRRRENEKRKEEEYTYRSDNYDPFSDYGERAMPCSYDEMNPEDEERKDYPFSMFGLKRSASQEDMKTAYRKLILETHPDRTGNDSSFEFRSIQEAYEYYKDFIM